ncbi:MAG TPA: Hpt domain-containing protein, partial [Myxococcaceae bacterium]|nr:Hpt domain-containing protein [Myxococcaceae bacterium]
MSPAAKGLSDFVAEATEILEGLGRDLLALDEHRGQEPDPDLLNGIFRQAHSLKGLAGLFAQERLAHLAHRAEDLLDRLRLGKVEAGDEVLDTLIEAVDVFQALIAEASRGRKTEGLTQRAEAMAKRLAGMGGDAPEPEADALDTLGLD